MKDNTTPQESTREKAERSRYEMLKAGRTTSRLPFLNHLPPASPDAGKSTTELLVESNPYYEALQRSNERAVRMERLEAENEELKRRVAELEGGNLPRRWSGDLGAGF